MGFFCRLLLGYFLLACSFLRRCRFLSRLLDRSLFGCCLLRCFLFGSSLLNSLFSCGFFGCWLFSGCLLFPLGPSRYHWDNFCKLERARGAFSRGLEKSTFLHAAGKCSLPH